MRRSPLLDRPGAVANPASDPDAAVPAHFGAPLPEQAALAAGRAVTALARDVVTVTGPDRLSWLTTLSSQVLTGLTPGDGGAETLLLDAQGHISHALAALDDGARLQLVTEAGRGPALVAFLESMRFMLRVEVALSDDVAVLAAMGEGIAALERAAASVLAVPDGSPEGAGTVSAESAGAGGGAWLGTWRDPWPGVVEGGTSYDVGLDRPHPGRGYAAGWVLVPAARAGAVLAAFLAPGQGEPTAQPGLRRRAAGSLAWEALRAEAGRPRWAREVDERAIPPELDWLRTAVYISKGCYPGQETIARTLNLGRPPRRLTILQLDGLSGELPRPGDAVLLGTRRVGAVTTVVRHHDYGPVALALLRRATPADAALTVAVTAEPDEAGEAGAPGAAGLDREEPVVVAQVDASQELLVSPEGRAQASPAERPGAGLRQSLLR